MERELQFYRNFIKNEQGEMDIDDKMIILKMFMIDHPQYVCEIETGVAIDIKMINDVNLLRNMLILLCQRHGVDYSLILS